MKEQIKSFTMVGRLVKVKFSPNQVLPGGGAVIASPSIADNILITDLVADSDSKSGNPEFIVRNKGGEGAEWRLEVGKIIQWQPLNTNLDGLIYRTERHYNFLKEVRDRAVVINKEFEDLFLETEKDLNELYKRREKEQPNEEAKQKIIREEIGLGK